MKLTSDQVARIAELAHLDLSAAEADSLARQLGDILGYIEKLNQLDTSATEPLAQVLAQDADPSASLRDDTPVPQSMAARIFPIAPDAVPPYFRVPKVVDKGE